MAFYGRLFPNIPPWIVAVVAFVPWLTVFGISFCHRPPFGPRPFRRCLVFAMSWYTGMTVIAEVLFFMLAPPASGPLPIGMARLLMYLFGTASIIVFVRACGTLRRYETDPAA